VQARVAARVAEAGIGIITLPQTNLFLQARDRRQSPPRGLTAVDALLEAGVAVAAGGDNFQDPFCTVGRVDPLETASLLVMAAHRRPDFAYDMVSEAGRRVLGRPDVSVAPGAPADLVAIDASSVRDAVASAPASRTVVRAGRVVAVTTTSTWLRS
jgi:cytosine deaminase